MSIAMMGISNEPMVNKRVEDYMRLCYSTSEGLYFNLVDKGVRARKAADTFFNMMEVYPSTKFPILREVF